MTGNSEDIIIIAMRVRRYVVFLGAVLLVISISGIVYASRVALAQGKYGWAKLMTPADDWCNILDLSESASHIYSANYYACILAAETAYFSSFGLSDKDAAENINKSQKWCDKGLKANSYRMQLHRLKTCLMARSSIPDAARYWERCVDWQFWEPANQALLVELYARTGQYEKAVDSLILIKESSYYAEASGRLNDAWKKEKDFPSDMKAMRLK